MKKAHTSVTNYVPELPKKTFKDWTEFNHTLAYYTAEHYFCFRVRSSEPRAKHNSRHGITQLPPKMTHSFKRMWCTHGALQESRGEGCRDYDSRFTDVKQVSSCALSVSSWIVKPKGK
ncbi:hypothetical protein PC121_g18736 [Phytophthora cactorum]|nr:hypothetical protein PC120_g22218 [Phytophthora cactorum]KAG3049790.1 hypothetical protein PC121_g18736 [Phytophthora cactorum]